MSGVIDVVKKHNKSSINKPRNGLGTYAYPDGRIYVGEFKDGVIFTLIGQTVVDFIGNNVKTVFFCHSHDLLHPLFGNDVTGGVGRRIDEYSLYF